MQAPKPQELPCKQQDRHIKERISQAERLNMDTKLIVTSYRTRIHDPHIFFSPDIPLKKLLNALKAYAKDVNPDTVLALIDNGWNAKEGALLTNTHIYCHVAIDAEPIIALNTIESVQFKGGFLAKLYINNLHFMYTGEVGNEEMQLFTSMLQEIATACCPQGSVAPVQASYAQQKESQVLNQICHRCKKQYPESEYTCPHCGYQKWRAGIGIFIAALVSAGLTYFLWTSHLPTVLRIIGIWFTITFLFIFATNIPLSVDIFLLGIAATAVGLLVPMSLTFKMILSIGGPLTAALGMIYRFKPKWVRPMVGYPMAFLGLAFAVAITFTTLRDFFSTPWYQRSVMEYGIFFPVVLLFALGFMAEGIILARKINMNEKVKAQSNIQCSKCGKPLLYLPVQIPDPDLEQWHGNVCTACNRVFCPDCIQVGGPAPCPNCGQPTLAAQRMNLRKAGFSV
jgi:hypothetical protein